MAGLRSWVGASAGDVVIRLAAQVLSTIVIARILSAEEFGVASMILASVAIVGALVSLPFEEALTQRQHLTTRHLESALFVSLGLTVGAVILALVAGPVLGRMSGAPELAFWLPVSTLFLFGQGPGSIARAVARRRRRFVDLAIGQSASVIVASAIAIGAALAGAGVLALVLQRMLPVIIYPVIAGFVAWWRGRGCVIWPRWDRARFGDIFRFSWLHLARVTVDYTSPAVLTFMTNAYFGTAVLGQLNVAMRLTEPLRSGIASVGHNLVLAFLVRLRSDRSQLAVRTLETVANFASLAVPGFIGLGICAPLLLPMLVGPGWDAAVPLAMTICVAAAISVPFRYLYTGFSAMGRPEFSVGCAGFGLATLVAGLTIVGRAGDAGALGGPIVATEVAAASLGVIFYFMLAGRVILQPLLGVLRICLAVALMAAVLKMIGPWVNGLGSPFLRLATVVGVGGAVYLPLLFLICRPCFVTLFTFVRPRRKD